MTVLIIGGGLAGPALALALRRRSIGSIVFEVRPTRSDSGGSISLAPNALLALDKVVGVYDRVKAEGFLYNKLDVWDETGYRFGEISQSEAAYPSVRILRSQLHKVLVEACEAEGIEIVYGARLDRIEDGANGVTAHFKDGTRASGASPSSLNVSKLKRRGQATFSSARMASTPRSATTSSARPPRPPSSPAR